MEAKNQRRFDLLSSETRAERSCARILTQMGIEYVKQFPINTGRRHYYADIYIPRLRLIIELDGGYHFTEEQRRKDSNRSAGIRRLGYHVYRLKNSDAYKPEKVKAKILAYMRSKSN